VKWQIIFQKGELAIITIIGGLGRDYLVLGLLDHWVPKRMLLLLLLLLVS